LLLQLIGDSSSPFLSRSVRWRWSLRRCRPGCDARQVNCWWTAG